MAVAEFVLTTDPPEVVDRSGRGCKLCARFPRWLNTNLGAGT